MSRIDTIKAEIKKRYRSERRFQLYGLCAIIFGVIFLFFLLSTTISNGYTALQQTYIALDITLSEADFNYQTDIAELKSANYGKIIKRTLLEEFPDATKMWEKKLLYKIVSGNAEYDLRQSVLDNPDLVGQTTRFWILADDEVDMLMKGKINLNTPEENRPVKDYTIELVHYLIDQGRVEQRFNAPFFNAGDSREPEQSGIHGAVMGSFFTILVTMLLAFPIGVAAAIYLHEFASKNRITNVIEVNINNLAAVPSIIFGLLGLSIFINFFGFPRSVPIVGGMVLSLMTLPTIIISSRAALTAVPTSIREAALGIGASQIQTIFHHVLPHAMPGILTGAIIGLAQALGETAPLLVIGMVAFIVDIPSSPMDPATVLPVQIYLWSDSPERAFVDRTYAAIMALLLFLIAINGLIVLLRKKLERHW